MILADGLLHLFGRATRGLCGTTFALTAWLEAENSAHQPIDPIVPRTDRSTDAGLCDGHLARETGP
jgi:hypothetical protein